MISCYNHLLRGGYNTEALMAAVQFCDVSKEETNKGKDNAVAALIIT